MTYRWLQLDLAAPLMAFGGVTVDQVGVTRDFPAISMLTGLFANALGLDWTDRVALQDLQDRLVFAAAIVAAGTILTDTQNAQLQKSDRGWTTWGAAEGRDGASYDAPHRRRRDHVADGHLVVVARLTLGVPSTEDLEWALRHPARPLFLGRKPCLPSRPILAASQNATTAHEALTLAVPRAARAQWPEGEGPAGSRKIDLPDLRNWISGLHGGTRSVVEGALT